MQLQNIDNNAEASNNLSIFDLEFQSKTIVTKIIMNDDDDGLYDLLNNNIR